MTAPCTFYIVRHGQTLWNVEGIIQGHMDSPLTPLGEQQARQLAADLAHVHFDAIFSSDLERARRTAEIIAQGRGVEVQTTVLLRERKFGHYEGRERESLFDNADIFSGMSDAERFQYTSSAEIESDEELVTRLLDFISEVAPRYPGKTVLAATHGGLMRAALIYLGYGTYANFSRVLIGNAAYVKLVADGSTLTIEETRGVPSPRVST